jgi:hypothetical protein
MRARRPAVTRAQAPGLPPEGLQAAKNGRLHGANGRFIKPVSPPPTF